MAQKECTIDKSGNKKRTSGSFSILLSVMVSLEISSSTYFLVVVVLYLKLNENIDQMHESTFLSYLFIGMSLVMSTILVT